MNTIAETLVAYKSVIIGVWIGSFFILERLLPSAAIPLDGKGRIKRLLSNAGLFGATALTSWFIVVPISIWAAATGPEWRAALIPGWTGIPSLIVDLLLLDFLIYWWHRFNHENQFLWRFHEVHHLDETLDTTTAVRFHWGEVILSACARCVFIMAFNIPIEHILIFEIQVLVAAIFVHSNVRLPAGLERILGWVIVTPAIHWIHHHAVRADTDSNYANVFSFWDRIFGSFSKTKRWSEMPIGVEHIAEKPFPRLLIRPFEKRRKPRKAQAEQQA